MEGPDSSYSCLLIHICWKVDSEAKMEPPIHTEYLRSGGAMIWREKGAVRALASSPRYPRDPSKAVRLDNHHAHLHRPAPDGRSP